MNPQQLLNEILPIIHSVMEDKQKLEKILRFLEDEIYEESPALEIPKKYKKLVSEIAGSIDAGMYCFVNTDTLEMEDIPEHMLTEDAEEFEFVTGESLEEMDFKHTRWEKYITIEPLQSGESFRIMESFADQILDNNLQKSLYKALNRKRPFANFKYIIDNSEFRQQWFDFKHARLEKHVYEIIEAELEK